MNRAHPTSSLRLLRFRFRIALFDIAAGGLLSPDLNAATVAVSAGNLLYPAVASTNILITITNAGGASPPSFTTQPQSRTVTNGSGVSFTAAASGSPTYQWRKNGTNLSGATSATYSIVSATTNDAGSYTVVASNAGGLATSVVASLTVLVPPGISTQPQSLSATQGGTAIFQVIAEGMSAPTYQRKFNTANLAGQNAASLPINNAQPANVGDYIVEVTNAAGIVASSIAHLTVQTTTGPLVLTNMQFIAGVGQFDVSGTPVVPTAIRASSDLVSWTPIRTNSNPAATWHFTDPLIPAGSSRFYRATPAGLQETKFEHSSPAPQNGRQVSA